MLVLASPSKAADAAAALGPTRSLGTHEPLNMGGETCFLWSIAPGRWWIVGPNPAPGALAASVGTSLGDQAHVSDQTEGRTLVRLSGSDVVDVLARLCPLNLSTEAFPTGSAAETIIDHVGAALAKTDDLPTIDLLLPSSYGGSIMHAITIAATSVAACRSPSGA